MFSLNVTALANVLVNINTCKKVYKVNLNCNSQKLFILNK